MSIYVRPKGDVRFQELSGARQPLPSAELDNEFNLMKDFINQSDFAAAFGSNLIVIDAGLAPETVDLALYQEVTVIKSDVSANAVTVSDSTGRTVIKQSSFELTGEDESIHLKLSGINWYRI